MEGYVRAVSNLARVEKHQSETCFVHLLFSRLFTAVIPSDSRLLSKFLDYLQVSSLRNRSSIAPVPFYSYSRSCNCAYIIAYIIFFLKFTFLFCTVLREQYASLWQLRNYNNITHAREHLCVGRKIKKISSWLTTRRGNYNSFVKISVLIRIWFYVKGTERSLKPFAGEM